MRALGAKIGSTGFLFCPIAQTFLERAVSASLEVAFEVHKRCSSYFEDLLAKKILWLVYTSVSSSRQVWVCWHLHQRILVLGGGAGQGESPIRLNHLPHRHPWIQVRKWLPFWGKHNGGVCSHTRSCELLRDSLAAMIIQGLSQLFPVQGSLISLVACLQFATCLGGTEKSSMLKEILKVSEYGDPTTIAPRNCAAEILFLRK